MSLDSNDPLFEPWMEVRELPPVGDKVVPFLTRDQRNYRRKLEECLELAPVALRRGLVGLNQAHGFMSCAWSFLGRLPADQRREFSGRVQQLQALVSMAEHEARGALGEAS